MTDSEQPHPGGVIPDRIADLPTWLIGRAYARSNGLLNAGFEGRSDGLRKYHYRLLAALQESGPVSQIELGRGTSVDRSDVVAVLDTLEQLGLATRAADPSDRRRNIVRITPAGAKRLNELETVIAGTQAKVLAPLSAAERDEFVRLLRLVVEG